MGRLTPERPPYTVISLDDVEEVPALGGALRWKPVRRTLGVQAFGINAYAADAGSEVVETHDEAVAGAGGHQEAYLVVRGRARFTLDGEEHDAPAGTLVFAEPEVKRGAEAVDDDTLVLAIGGDPAVPYRVSPWESWFLADARSLAGDHDAALEIMAGARGDHKGNPAFHYNHACLMVRAGRLDEAVAELARAHEADPERIAHRARDDEDLDPLRDRPDWPLR